MTLYSPKRIAFMPPVIDLEYPAELLAARKAAFIEQIQLKNEQTTYQVACPSSTTNPLSDGIESCEILPQDYDTQTCTVFDTQKVRLDLMQELLQVTEQASHETDVQAITELAQQARWLKGK